MQTLLEEKSSGPKRLSSCPVWPDSLQSRHISDIFCQGVLLHVTFFFFLSCHVPHEIF